MAAKSSSSTALTLLKAHGTSGDSSWPHPTCVAVCEEAVRKDQGNDMPAHEYLDSPEVLRLKIKALAELIKRSRFTVAYTGAGLSRAAGIPDYATKATDSVIPVAKKKKGSMMSAQPTYSHFALAAMQRTNMIHLLVQQNHDGLPQKAGFPQEKMNEIHGAWYDPSNPVVMFSGSLRDDLYAAMVEAEGKTDLTLCLGTSLSGMNADRMAVNPALKAEKGKALGTVIINLQQTRLDDLSTLRIWSKLDAAFELLMAELSLAPIPTSIFRLTQPGEVFNIRYNAKGKLDTSVMMKLDLRIGQTIRIVSPGAVNEGEEATVLERSSEGNWKLKFVKGKIRTMGRWWIDAAYRESIDQFPLTNKIPEIRAAGAEALRTSTAAAGPSTTKIVGRPATITAPSAAAGGRKAPTTGSAVAGGSATKVGGRPTTTTTTTTKASPAAAGVRKAPTTSATTSSSKKRNKSDCSW